MILTDHAFRRFVERGSISKYNKINKSIENMLKNKTEVAPIGQYKVKCIMANNYRETKYYRASNIVFVERENTIVSVLNYKNQDWETINK